MKMDLLLSTIDQSRAHFDRACSINLVSWDEVPIARAPPSSYLFFYTSSPHTRYPGKHTVLLQCNIHIYIRAVERVSCEKDIIAGRPLSAAASIAAELGW